MRKSKILYLDTETTGLSAAANAMIEVACIVEVNGKEVDRLDFNINPYTYNKDIIVDDEALKHNGKTKEQLKTFPKSKDQFKMFIKFLNKHIKPRDKTDKMQICGYNVRFDIDFLQAWFEDNKNPFYGAYFSYKDLDVFAVVKYLTYIGHLNTENEQLGTICEHFGIELDVHIAINDITATHILHNKLIKKYFKKVK